MASKPETTFTRSVNRLLEDKVYFEKMNNPFRAGTPDFWYSGDDGEMWVEYKYTPSLPRSKDYSLDLSPRQVRWLEDRHREGRTVAVILGVPAGGIIFPDLDWKGSFSRVDLESRVVARIDVAAWVLTKVGVSTCVSSRRSQRPQP